MPLNGDELFYIRDELAGGVGFGVDNHDYTVQISDAVNYFISQMVDLNSTILDFSTLSSTDVQDISDALNAANLLDLIDISDLDFSMLSLMQAQDVVDILNNNSLITVPPLDFSQTTLNQAQDLADIFNANGLIDMTGTVATTVDFSSLTLPQAQQIADILNNNNLITQNAVFIEDVDLTNIDKTIGSVFGNNISINDLCDVVVNISSLNEGFVLRSDGTSGLNLQPELKVVDSLIMTDISGNVNHRITLSDSSTFDVPLSDFLSNCTDNALELDPIDGRFCVRSNSIQSPIFVSPDTIFLNENQPLNFTPVVSTSSNNYTLAIENTTQDASLFQFVGNSITYIPTHTPDFETKQYYVFVVSATDSLGNTGYQTIKINLLNVNDNAPFFPEAVNGMMSYTLDSNTKGFAFQIFALDFDRNYGIIYNLTGPNSSDFIINTQTGLVRVNADTGLTQNSYTLVATASDGNNQITATVNINVINQDTGGDDSNNDMMENMMWPFMCESSCTNETSQSCTVSTTNNNNTNCTNSESDDNMNCGNPNCLSCKSKMMSFMNPYGFQSPQTQKPPRITGIVPLVVQKGGQIVISAVDHGNGSLQYQLLNAPTGLSLNGNVINVSSDMPEGPYNFTVSVSDSCNLVDQQNVTIVVGMLNTAPIINSISPTEVAPGDIVNIVVTNQDNDELTYELIGAPPSITLNPSNPNQIIVGAATVNATYCMTVKVCDPCNLCDEEQLILTVGSSTSVGNNAPPIFNGINGGGTGATSITVAPNTATQFSINAIDPEGDGLGFQLAGQPNGISISPTGLVTVDSTLASGQYSFNVIISDSAGNNVTQPVMVTVGTTNPVPILTVTSNMFGPLASGDSFTPSYGIAPDPTDTHTYSIDSTSIALGYMINSANGEITVPANAPDGTAALTVFVTDSDNQVSNGVNLSVIIDTNVAPIVNDLTNSSGASIISSGSVEVGDILNIIAMDPDGDNLIYTTTAPSGSFSINSSNGQITVLSGAENNSPYSFAITATDPSGLSDSITVANLTVTADTAPQFLSLSSGSINPGDNVVVTGVDVENNPMDITIDSVSPTPSIGSFTITTLNDNQASVTASSNLPLGTYLLNFRFTQRNNPSLFTNSQQLVNIVVGNRAPSVTTNGGSITSFPVIVPGATFDPMLVKSDPDGDMTEFGFLVNNTYTTSQNGFSIDATTGVITAPTSPIYTQTMLSVTAREIGTSDLFVGLSPVTVTVDQVNQPPVISLVSPPMPIVDAPAGAMQNITLNLTDNANDSHNIFFVDPNNPSNLLTQLPVGGSPEYTITNNTDNTNSVAKTIVIGVIPSNTASSRDIDIVAVDSGGLISNFVTLDFDVTVNSAPFITGIVSTLGGTTPVSSVAEGQSVFISAGDSENDVITYGVSNLPTGWTIDTSTGEITTSNTASTGSPYSLDLTATDLSGSNITTTQTVNLTVTSSADVTAPIIMATNYASNGVVGGDTASGVTTILPDLTMFATDDVSMVQNISYIFVWGTYPGVQPSTVTLADFTPIDFTGGTDQNGLFTQSNAASAPSLDLSLASNENISIPGRIGLRVEAVDEAGNQSAPVLVNEGYDIVNNPLLQPDRFFTGALTVI